MNFLGQNTNLPTAEQVSYDNLTSGLVADDVQDAIDELSSGAGAGCVLLNPVGDQTILTNNRLNLTRTVFDQDQEVVTKKYIDDKFSTLIDDTTPSLSSVYSSVKTDATYPTRPGTTTDNTLVRYDGTTGQIQSSATTLSDTGNLTLPGTLSLSGGLIFNVATDNFVDTQSVRIGTSLTDGVTISTNKSGGTATGASLNLGVGSQVNTIARGTWSGTNLGADYIIQTVRDNAIALEDRFSINSDLSVNILASPLNVTGLVSSLNMDTTASNAWTKQQYATANTESNSGAYSWNLDDKQANILTLTGNITSVTVSNMKAGATYILMVKQDATPYTIAFGSQFKWPEGADFIASTGANEIDIVSFFCDGTYMYGVGTNNFLA